MTEENKTNPTPPFLLLPESQIFDTAHMAKHSRDFDNSSLQMFIKAWNYTIDAREKVIVISQEMNHHLIENKYKSEKKKRMTLFSTLRVHPELFGVDAEKSMIQLTTLLSIEEDKKVYYVTDNPNMQELLKKVGIFEVIDSKKACELLDNILPKII